MTTLDRLTHFWRDPFDPVNNVALFAMLDRAVGPAWRGETPPDDPETAWKRLRAYMRLAGDPGGAWWQWPDEAEFKAAWPALTDRARHLALYHDLCHVELNVGQDAAGEYELAVRLLAGDTPEFLLSCVSAPKGLGRLYGALAISTLPLGCLRAGTAPLRGVLAGLLAVASGIDGPRKV